MAKTPYYTKAESDSKNWEVFREVKQTTEAISAGQGGKLYDTLAAAQAVDPKPVDGTVFTVSNVTDLANSGVYTFQSGSTGGTRFERSLTPTGEVGSELGVNPIPANTNFLEELTGSDLLNKDLWATGFLKEDGTIQVSTSLYHSRKYYPIPSGVRMLFSAVFAGDMRCIVYDNDLSIVLTITGIYNAPTVKYIDLPSTAAYIRVSHRNEYGDTSNISFLNEDVNYRNQLASNVSENTKSFTARLGFETLPNDYNFIQELSNSDITDLNIWNVGYIQADGTILGDVGHRYSIKYYPISPSEVLDLGGYFAGSAIWAIYDENKNIIQAIVGTYNVLTEKRITTPSNAAYIRVSHRISFGSVSDIFLKSMREIEKNRGIAVVNKNYQNHIKQFIKDSAPSLRKKIPMVTFISDDGNLAEDEWYIPIINQKNIKTTLAIITDFAAGRLSKLRVKELYDLGFDIAGHTHNHLNLTELTLAEAEEELLKCKTELWNIGIDAEMFVAPFGGVNAAIRDLIKNYYKANFITGSRAKIDDGTCCNGSPLNPMQLNRVSFDGTTLARCKEAVDVSLANSEWLVFTVHPAYDEYDSVSRHQDLSDLIDYIQASNISIVTAKNAYRYWKNNFEMVNPKQPENTYLIGMDGTVVDKYF